jgi:hypothetical protein
VGSTASRTRSRPPTGPVLTVAAMGRGSVAVAGGGLTPGGHADLALVDVWGTTPNATRWTVATSTGFGHNGRHDPAAGDGGGTIAEQLTGLCGATWMIRGYDEATGSWSDWLAIRPSDAGRALEQTPGC